jgi:hypothetical protein
MFRGLANILHRLVALGKRSGFNSGRRFPSLAGKRRVNYTLM